MLSKVCIKLLKLKNKKTNNLKKWNNDLNRYLTNKNIQMANKYMKRYSTSNVIREMRIKTTMWCLYTEHWQNKMLVRMCGPMGTLIHCQEEYKVVKNGTNTVKDSLVASYKTRYILLLYKKAITSPAIYSQGWKFYIHIKSCTLTFIGALFIIYKTWKQSRCLSVGG